MKRNLVVLLAAGVLSVTLGPSAEASRGQELRERIETKEYNAPAPGVMTPVPWGVVTFNCYQGFPEGCVRFKPRSGERFVSVEIEDGLGQPVYFWIGQREEDLQEYCGTMDKPLRIQPRLEITVFLIEGTCRGTYTPSVVSRGTVTATFTNRR